MAKTYRLTDAGSDLSLGGAFTDELVATANGSNAITATNTGGVNSGYYAAEANDPSTDGTSTGTFTAVLNVSTAAGSTQARCYLRRVNSSGATQAEVVSPTGYVSTATTGDKTWSWTNPALGTWASGDRVVLRVEVQNNAAHGGAAGPTFSHTATNTRLETPFAVAPEEHSGSATLSGGGDPAATGAKGGLSSTTVAPSIADRTAGVQTSDSSTWTLDYPETLEQDDLIAVFIAIDGNPTVSSAPTGMVHSLGLAASTGNAVTLAALKAVAVGDETGTFDITWSAAQQGSWRVLRIVDWHVALGSNYVNSDPNGGSYPGGGSATGTDTTPNNGALTPFNWSSGFDPTMFIVAIAADHGDSTITGIPTDYTADGTAQESGGADGAALHVATRTRVVTTEFPGDWSIEANGEEWITRPFAVRPFKTALVWISGGGALSASGVAEEGGNDKSGTATLSGGGSLVVSATKAASGTAVVSGGGTVSATGSKSATSASTISGGGDVLATGQKHARAPPALSGGGSLAATVTTARSVTGSASGGGDPTSTGSSDRVATTTLSGGGDPTSVGEKGALATVSISGGGSLSVTGSSAESHSGSATLAGGGSLVVSSAKGALSTSTTSGGGALSGSVTTARSVSATTSGGGTIAATGSGSESSGGSASLSGGGSLTVAGASARSDSSTTSGGGAATSTVTTDRPGVATTSGGGALSASGSQSETHSGSATLSGGGSTTSSGRKHSDATTSTSGGGSVGGSGEHGTSRSIAISGGGTTTSSGLHEALVLVSLSGGGSTVATGSPGTPATPPSADRTSVGGTSGQSGVNVARGTTHASAGGSGRSNA